MTRQSTTVLTVGPSSIAPWGDRVWRVSGSAQLVEGSTPYWIVTPTLPANHPATPAEIEVAAPLPGSVVDSVLLLLAVHFGDDDVEAFLTETHNISVEEGVRVIAPYWDLSDETVGFLAEHLSATLRLGFTLLDDLCLVDDVVIETLRALGFDVEVFAPISGSGR